MSLTTDQLNSLDTTDEVQIRTRADGGSIDTIIWIVVIDGEVYVRSVQGEDGKWYRRAIADPSVAILVGGDQIDFHAKHVEDENVIMAVSEALRQKYPPGGPLDRMTRPEVLNTTLRLLPADVS